MQAYLTNTTSAKGKIEKEHYGRAEGGSSTARVGSREMVETTQQCLIFLNRNRLKGRSQDPATLPPPVPCIPYAWYGRQKI